MSIVTTTALAAGLVAAAAGAVLVVFAARSWALIDQALNAPGTFALPLTWDDYAQATIYALGAATTLITSGLIAGSLRRQAATFEALAVAIVTIVLYGGTVVIVVQTYV